MTLLQTATRFQPSFAADGVPVTIAEGDGIGPEIMSACLQILQAAGARIQPEPIRMGEAVYRSGVTSGIPAEAWASLQRTRVLYKGPITTPQGGGYKSLNVTLRKSLGLYANIRPCAALSPFVATQHPNMDVIIIRENEEDLYAGIEHRQTAEVYQCLKIISRPGCERIIRHAFEHARAHGRKKVTCLTKDNIMKLTDGLFHRVFDEIGAEYPDLQQEHLIIDIGTARLAAAPEQFDVVVTLNLYGDILSDVAAEIAGSVGLGASANLGEHAAMFEAIHGSAPMIAGKGIANPSGLLLAGVMMLVHIGQPEIAERVQNAWARTIEDGIHTGDIAGPETTRKVGTQDFAEAVIARLGQKPKSLPLARFGAAPMAPVATRPRQPSPQKRLDGVDVFLDAAEVAPEALARHLQAASPAGLTLEMISNRGVKVWPEGLPETFCTDHWRCRFMAADGRALTGAEIVSLQSHLLEAGLEVIKTENLYRFDGERGYSLGQGQ